MIDAKCKEIDCEHYIEWNFGYGMCYSCKLQGESYHIEKPAEDRNCPLYGIKEGGRGMKILKKVKRFFDKIWRHTCGRCGCVFEFDDCDLKRDRDGLYVICPHCGAFISVAVVKGGEKMSIKQRLIKRLNKAFNLGITDKTPIICRMNNRHGGFSWVIALGSHDIGSCVSMTECLRWKRWVLCMELGELFEYCEKGIYNQMDIIEPQKGGEE